MMAFLPSWGAVGRKALDNTLSSFFLCGSRAILGLKDRLVLSLSRYFLRAILGVRGLLKDFLIGGRLSLGYLSSITGRLLGLLEILLMGF